MALRKVGAFSLLFVFGAIVGSLTIGEAGGNFTLVSDTVRSIIYREPSAADVARQDAYRMLRSVHLKVRSSSTPAQFPCEAPVELTFAVDDAAKDAERLMDWEAAYSNQEFVDRAMVAIRAMESTWLELRLWKCE